MALIQHQVPKKLTAGMAVVIYIRPGTRLSDDQFKAGMRAGKWFKAQLRDIGSSYYAVKFNKGYWIVPASTCILVRSTSYADSVDKKNTDRLNAAKYRK